MRKSQIVEELGEGELLLPALIEAALQANDRAKLRMTALQEAVAHAKAPLRPVRLMAAEARAAGATEDGLDATVTGAQIVDGGGYAIPGARRLMDGILDDIATMAAPLDAAQVPAASGFSDRLAALRSAFASITGDMLDEPALVRLTSARRGGEDSAHLVVMDLHKALNQLSAAVAAETIAGARALGVRAEDHDRIEAFMAGLNRTRGLAFGHPGLDTTASRSGARLILQNDIGTTDAHVIILAVEGLDATVTYTDVHRSRAKFFISLFRDFSATWTPLAERSVAGLAEGGSFFLVTGRYTARDTADLDSFLDAVGAHLVFLIDWNKARKTLQTFVDKATAIRLLTDAARVRFGHRAFLELGGAELIFDAVRRSAEGRVPYGARLDRVLGAGAVARLLGEVLRLTSEGLGAQRSVRLIKDEVRAELARSFGSAEQEVLAMALTQLGLARMLAAEVAEALDEPGESTDGVRAAFQRRAKRLEEKADRQVLAARDLASGPFGRGRRFLPLAEWVEEATDSFEEAAFLLGTRSRRETTDAASPLAELVSVAMACCGDLVRAVAAACEGPAGRREDITDALEAIDAVMEGERRADEAHRRVVAAVLGDPAPVPASALVATMEVARAMETGTDHLARAALALRGCVLEEVGS
ncbi:conserved hypothetical protein [Xanthobacter versatilis]|uniref:Phosphate transport regulator n=1 Tax=Xanthobacter autotrophicus (strain ATCC BAA-1158 / Py2) TaxID=78245 RepID=A7IND2_XANP2|nr:conserved hypothetical protein [Xanthobacter autotrophicus Py2]